MDLWWRIAGSCRVRLTGADLLHSLDRLSRQLRLEQIRWEDGLTLTVWIARKDWKTVQNTAQALGDRAELLEERGLPARLRPWKGRPILGTFLVLLTALSLWLPGRVLFVEAEGNREIPAALILEKAADCGVRFGAVRRELRSEQIKNELLLALPELSWAGVNTKGCVATVTVRERDPDRREPARIRGDIVAARSGILTDLTATAGTPLCRPGQAVQKGEVLISGVQELGLYTRFTAAAGEAFAATVTQIRAVLPEKTETKAENGKPMRRVSVIFGKKRINLYADSGILAPGCGKMREAIPLRLPGGRRLPVTLIIDTCERSRWSAQTRPEQQARALLYDGIRREILGRSVAAEIRTERLELSRQDRKWILEGQVGCREMIGRFSQGVYLEDDASDD